MNKKFFLFACLVVLVLSFFDAKIIPYYKVPGLDFSNNYGYHHCSESTDSIYHIEPLLCQDFESRPYVYPPTLYYLFSWTRFFPTVTSAYSFFVSLSVLIFIIVAFIWSINKSISYFLFSLGLFFTFPNLFLLERGNTDLFIVLFWSLSFSFYKKTNVPLMAFFLTLPVFAKLYPVYAFIPLIFFFLFNRESKISPLKYLIIFSLIFILISPYLWFEYLVDILPKWSSARTPMFNLSHSLKSLSRFGSPTFFAMLVSWIYLALRSSKKNINLLWAGALAISTFNNGVSFDYNLVTTFPLLLVLFHSSAIKRSFVFFILFILLLSSIVGPRVFFLDIPIYPSIRTLCMAITLILIPFFFINIRHDFILILNKVRYAFAKIRTW